MLIFALPVCVPIGHYPSLLGNLLQHSAHTLAVGGRQLIALVEGARSGQGVAVFHRPIEHVSTRALQAEGAALLGDVLFHKHTKALVAIVYSNGVVLGHCCIVYRLTTLSRPSGSCSAFGFRGFRLGYGYLSGPSSGSFGILEFHSVIATIAHQSLELSGRMFMLLLVS